MYDLQIFKYSQNQNEVAADRFLGLPVFKQKHLLLWSCLKKQRNWNLWKVRIEAKDNDIHSGKWVGHDHHHHALFSEKQN